MYAAHTYFLSMHLVPNGYTYSIITLKVKIIFLIQYLYEDNINN